MFYVTIEDNSEPDPEPTPEPTPEPSTSGCGGALVASIGSIAILSLALVFLKREID